MNRSYSIIAAALFIAAPVAGAQVRLADVRAIPTTVSREDPPEAWSAKPVGNYDVILNSADRKISVRVTVSEMDGKLIALFWPADDAEGHAMDVTVAGTDLVLTAKTRRGPLEVDIERRGQKLSGSWTLGSLKGSLKGDITS
jgi:hypothetical protein